MAYQRANTNGKLRVVSFGGMGQAVVTGAYMD